MKLARLRTEIRTNGRSARRLVDGTRELGGRVAAGWLLDRVRGAESEGAVTNSSLTWVTAGTTTTTLLWLHNYWGDTYGIESPELEFILVDCIGDIVAQRIINLDENATVVIDVRAECRTAAVALPFEGQVLLRMSHDRLQPSRPVQVFAEYVTDAGGATGVHGQYGLFRAPLAQRIGAMRVEDPSTASTSIVLTNAWDQPNRPPIRPLIELRNAYGTRLSHRAPAIAAGSTSRIDLNRIFDDLGTFLRGLPGHVSIAVPYPASRILSHTEYVDGRVIVNHGTIDRGYDQARGVDADWQESWPVVSVPIIWTDEREIVLTLPNRYGPIIAAYVASVVVFDETGRRVAEFEIDLPREGLGEVNVAHVLAERGISAPFIGHGEITVRSVSVPEQPVYIDVIVGLVDRGQRVGEVLAGSDFFNAPVPVLVGTPDIRRTRVFGRVSLLDSHQTFVYLANPGGRADYDHRAVPTLTLWSLDGRRHEQVQIEIAPHGCIFAPIEEIFVNARETLGESRAGTVRVRDTGARLYGYHLVDGVGPTVPICHLIGG